MAQFTPGNQIGVNGRPKGIKDKRHHYYDVQAKLHERGHDPIDAIIELAQDPLADPALRFRANQELISKISPSVKAIEQRVGDALTNDDMEYIKGQMKELLAANKRDF